jgi:hypothetical protein
MPTNLLEVAMKIYKPTEYGYQIRGNGTKDMNGDGLKDIDCSGMVSSVLRATGYVFPQRDRFNTDWLRSKNAEEYFEVVDKKDVQPGDIVVWGPSKGEKYGYTGFVDEYDALSNRGSLYGSSSSTEGPAFIDIPRNRLNTRPENGGVKFLRPKKAYHVDYYPGPFSEAEMEPVHFACASTREPQHHNDDDYHFSPGMGM